MFQTGKAKWEFARAMMGIQRTLTSSKVSREEKRKSLCKVVNSLSDETYTLHVPEIIEIINKKEEVCKEYENTGAQVEGIIEWLPRIKSHEAMLYEIIKQHRQRYKLKV